MAAVAFWGFQTASSAVAESWEASVTKAPAVSKWLRNNGKLNFSEDIKLFLSGRDILYWNRTKK